MRSLRGTDFQNFTQIVLAHIENYTIPQYGDKPSDQLEDWSVSECMRTIKKYAARSGTNSRGRLEDLRDLVKIAHFAQVAFEKMKPSIEEKLAIEEGRSL